MTDDHLPTRTEGEGETLDMPEGFLAPGQVLGDRYQIKSQLGRGGMGEVWRAFDLKLRVEVALKAMLPELFKNERRRDLLRREVRAAREVVSPNVCRIFDLIEVDGRELVSMEYVDGGTLLNVLHERGPLDLKEAQDVASQFLAGLEAIHQARLVHRDVKPENIMITRAGRVVLMDFGLARQEDGGAGTVSGTPAYMAPEQAMGGKVDARADVYSAGVVLAEMVSPDGIKDLQSRQSVWEGIRHEPARVPDSPWAPVLKKAVAKEPDNRYNSAHTLTRALEDVTLRVEGAEDLTPYPGLASFTEEDAEYFFGREAEVEAMWAKLDRPHLLGLIGPSGAGKSSFIRAGLLAAAPPNWSCLVCTPGDVPVLSLGRALARAMVGDPEIVEQMLSFDEPDVAINVVSRWRNRTSNGFLVVDQFEELFTQNAPEVQRRFAELLSRIAVEADVHVLLSMRDDFLFRCSDQPALAPVFSELTPLRPPSGSALRRAVTQPAMKCGYRFEDDELVEEVLAEVEGERGALPLLAFAMARLWEKRDRDNGLLTRQAYHDIGGVGGALARHAEATIDRIGVERLPIVRELFRNLVTAEGTRAVREWDELLSVFDAADAGRAGVKPAPAREIAASEKRIVGAGVFPARDVAEEALRELIDARLLTSYEIGEGDEAPTRRVEIIHESLLANWPRLVGWQTQDADSSRLRDELRQAARTWEEHDRSDDLLWTGSAYREFAVWRERYPGGLSATEDAFAGAMTSLATRRRRRRRIAVAVGFAVLFAGLAIVGSFWQRSLREARRAEAANLVSLGQLELESYPSATVAHAIASLELADGPGARRLALEALWKGPTALVATEDFAWWGGFSPDGRSLVQAEYQFAERDEGHLSIISADGFREYLSNENAGVPYVDISKISESGHFASAAKETDSSVRVVVWSLNDIEPLADTNLSPSQSLRGVAVDSNRRRAVLLILDGAQFSVYILRFNGEFERLGTLEFETKRNAQGGWTTGAALDPRAGEWLGVVTENRVFVARVGDDELGPPRLLGRHVVALSRPATDPLGRFIATAAEDGEIRLWDLTGVSPPKVLQGPPGIRFTRFTSDGVFLEAAIVENGEWVTWVWDLSESSPQFLLRRNLEKTGWGGWRWDTDGRQLAWWGKDMMKVRIWSMDAPPSAEPLVLNRGDNQQMNDVNFSPAGPWLVTADAAGLAIWPFVREYPLVLRPKSGQIRGLAFDPVGRWLVSSATDGAVKLWPLKGDPPPPERDLGFGNVALAVSPDGDRILAGAQGGNGVNVFYSDGRPSTKLPRPVGEIWSVAFTPDGRQAAGVGGIFNPAERVIVVWDLASEEVVKVLDVGESPHVFDLQFTGGGDLLSMSESGLYRWNVETGERELLYAGDIFRFFADPSGKQVIGMEREDASDLWGEAFLLDLDSGDVRHLGKFGKDVSSVSLDPTGTFVVTGNLNGEVRVGTLNGDEPHLLLGHETAVSLVAIDPLGRWVASGSDDMTIRLWPMPDLSKPPFHTLPREELIAKLKTLTNLRLVRDEESASGWKLEVGPFPGWETVPTW